MKPCVCRFFLTGIACLCLCGCGQSTPRPSLSQAIEKGDLKTVRQYLAGNPDLASKNASGWAPLHLAAMKGDLAIVQALVEAGADAKQPGKDGKTPLQLAREKGRAEVVTFLEGSGSQKPGRRLIDGGLGVSEAMDNL